jgi:nickel/cobalt exporter
MKPCAWPLLFVLAATLFAHPMGNFSVSHYARIEVNGGGAEIRYVLDLAEIPSFQLLQQWGLSADSPRNLLEAKAQEQGREWVRNLSLACDGRAVSPRFEGATLAIVPGAGGSPVMRITSILKLAVAAGSLSYEDRNYPDRAGWKEVVVAAGPGASIERSSQDDTDRSLALTAYPADPTVAPPQDLKASVEWSAADPMITKIAPPKTVPTVPLRVAAAPTPAPRATSPVPPQPTAPGTVVRGDFLSRLLHRGDIGLGLILLGMAVAFGLGCMHALSPGHGKTIVAAYLVGSRGTFKHAIFLGGMVTFTHTISVFFLGLTTLFLSQYVLPEKIFPVLGAISGLSIVWIGGLMLYKRARRLRLAGHSHDHDHPHHHREHDHTHEHGHDHDRDHLEHGHDHGPHGHSHVPEGDITLGSLIALGASGGLVPCPSALVLLLSSIALGRVGLGLLLLIAFSSGLAVVLMGIGVLVLYAKHFLPDSQKTAAHPAFRIIPVVSAALIVCIGLLMTGVSLGWIQPSRLAG